MSQRIPGSPLMTHYPSSPMSTVPITVLYYESILIMSKKFKTMTTPTLEKLTVANIREGPSESFSYRPYRFESLSLKRE